MRRTGSVATCLFAVILMTAALTGFGQAPQGRQPAPKTQPEFNAYTAFFNEKDPAKKAELGEQFIAGFKESELIPTAYKLTIQAYTNSKNWAKVMDAADRFAALPGVDNDSKAYAYLNAINAAQNLNDLNKLIAYGEKVLAIDPNNLNALITLSAVIPQKYPSEPAQLDKAAEMANKALAGLQPLMDKAPAQEKPQYAQIDGSLHETLGLIAYDKKDYKKSIQEYTNAIKSNAKSDTAHFYLSYDYISLMGLASKEYLAAIDAEKAAIAAKADQPTMDELKAKTAGYADDVRRYRDLAIDDLAIAVALNGPVAQQARDELTKQWTAKNNDTNGLEQFIAQKKTQIGG